VSRSLRSTSARLIDDVPSCAALVERMLRECREHLERALSFMPARRGLGVAA